MINELHISNQFYYTFTAFSKPFIFSNIQKWKSGKKYIAEYLLLKCCICRKYRKKGYIKEFYKEKFFKFLRASFLWSSSDFSTWTVCFVKNRMTPPLNRSHVAAEKQKITLLGYLYSPTLLKTHVALSSDIRFAFSVCFSSYF